MKILFIGSSGMLGYPVAKELMNAGFEVNLLARNPEKLQKQFPGIKIIKGDVFDRASLIEAFPGYEIVYLNLSINQNRGNSSWQTEREGISNIIVAAKEIGIKRIAYLSSVIQNYQGMNGFRWWAFDIKQKAIEKIRSSEISYSIFYPSTFFETLGRDMIKGKRLILPTGSIAPMWFIGANDYGKQVAKALQIAGDSNQEYIIQGLEPFTFNEAAQVMIANHKTKLKLFKVPLSLIKPFRFLSPKISYGWHIIEALNKYPEKFESQQTWNELGTPIIWLADYAKTL
jgi:uncharacterized protein YbjT (DUF2867 family)